VMDLNIAGRNDDYEQTLNYVEIYTLVKDIVEKGQYNLIEAIGTAIINQIADSFNMERIVVRVRKPHPPVGGCMDAVEFEVLREG